MTDSARFHNAIRILLNLGQHDLAAAGVIDSNWGSAEASDRDQVEAFMDDPIREALRMPDANYERLFALIESRQKPKDLSAFDLLCRCFDAFDGEEDSVKEEHADLIEEVAAFIDAAKAKAWPFNWRAALKARIDGVWDDPDLKFIGPLGDTQDDILRILKFAGIV